MARGFLTTSLTRLLPRLRTVTLLPALASLTFRAASTAVSSKVLTTGATPGGGTTLLVAASTLKLAGGASGSGTCFTQTINSINDVLLQMVDTNRDLGTTNQS